MNSPTLNQLGQRNSNRGVFRINGYNYVVTCYDQGGHNQEGHQCGVDTGVGVLSLVPVRTSPIVTTVRYLTVVSAVVYLVGRIANFW